MSDAVRLSFKEMCAKFDVTPRTLRYYEYIELLQPERDGRARWYGPREVARMTLILRGRRFGKAWRCQARNLHSADRGERRSLARVGPEQRLVDRQPIDCLHKRHDRKQLAQLPPVDPADNCPHASPRPRATDAATVGAWKEDKCQSRPRYGTMK